MELNFSACLASALAGGEWQQHSLCSRGNSNRELLNGKLGEPQSLSVRHREEKTILFLPWVFSLLSNYFIAWAICRINFF